MSEKPIEFFDEYHMIHVIDKSAYNCLVEINKVLSEALERALSDLIMSMGIQSNGITAMAIARIRDAIAKAKEMGK